MSKIVKRIVQIELIENALIVKGPDGKRNAYRTLGSETDNARLGEAIQRLFFDRHFKLALGPHYEANGIKKVDLEAKEEA